MGKPILKPPNGEPLRGFMYRFAVCPSLLITEPGTTNKTNDSFNSYLKSLSGATLGVSLKLP